MKTIKRCVVWLLTLAMTANLFIYALPAASAESAQAWDGTLDFSWYDEENRRSEYHIQSPAQWSALAWICSEDLEYLQGDYQETTQYNITNIIGTIPTEQYTFPGVQIYLDCDLDMGGTYNETQGIWSGPNYYPIGGEYHNDGYHHALNRDIFYGIFAGSFDGQGHTIYNIYCSRGWGTSQNAGAGWYQAAGLFGRVGVMSERDRSNSDIVIENVAVKGFVETSRSAGGIVGKTLSASSGHSVIIRNCLNYATVTNSDAKGAGGIVGAAWNGCYIINCANFGTVICGMKNGGGIAGSSEATCISCYNVGDISQSSYNNGQAFGTDNGGTTLTNFYYAVESVYDHGSPAIYSAYKDPSAFDYYALSKYDMTSLEFVRLLNKYAAQYGNWVIIDGQYDNYPVPETFGDGDNGELPPPVTGTFTVTLKGEDYYSVDVQKEGSSDVVTYRTGGVFFIEADQAADLTILADEDRIISGDVTGVTNPSSAGFSWAEQVEQRTETSRQVHLYWTHGNLTINVNTAYGCTHQYTVREEQFPTCTEEGYQVLECSKCGYTYTETLPVQGHDYAKTVVAPTLDERGYTEYACRTCGDGYVGNYTWLVRFESNGGSAVKDQIVAVSELAEKPSDPTHPNADMKFAGWYLDEGCTRLYDFSKPVDTSMTLYAAWSETVWHVRFSGENAGAVVNGDLVPEAVVREDGNNLTFEARPEFGYELIDVSMSEIPAEGIWDGVSVATSFAGGTGTQANPYLISSAAQLAYLSTQTANSYKKYYKLTCSIDLNGYPWTPIGTESSPFKGVFDGGGYTINNLNASASGATGAAGLFGYVAYGSSPQLDAYGRIQNLTVKGTVSGRYAGGIVGYLYAGTVSNCVSYVTVSTPAITGYMTYAGGIAGFFENSSIAGPLSVATVINCFNYGSVTGNYAGGIAGNVKGGLISDCINSGTVTGTAYVGGVAAYLDRRTYGGDGIILRCGNHGDVIASNSLSAVIAGGVVGAAKNSTASYSGDPGGNTKIQDCYNTGSVFNSGPSATTTGGVAGSVDVGGSGIIGLWNCYNTGTIQDTLKYTAVTKAHYIGGVAGNAMTGTYIQNCYSTGTLASNSANYLYWGGLTGNKMTSFTNVQNNYFLNWLTTSVGAPAWYGGFTNLDAAVVQRFEASNPVTAGELGGSYREDTEGINGGYPILTWQPLREPSGGASLIDNGDGTYTITNVTADMTVYITAQKKTYLVTFVSEHGNAEAQWVTYGETATDPNLTDPNYRIEGWFTDQEYTQLYDFSQPVSENLILYAKWDFMYYLATFYMNDGAGTIYQEKKIQEEPLTPPEEDPVRDGYDFTGWYTHFLLDRREEFDFSQPVTEDVSIWAGWEKTTYTVTVDPDNGEDPTEQRIIYLEYAEKPAEDPERKGYIFAGWYLEEEGDLTTPFSFGSMPVTGNLVIKAKWAKVQQVQLELSPETAQARITLQGHEMELQEDGTYLLGEGLDYFYTVFAKGYQTASGHLWALLEDEPEEDGAEPEEPVEPEEPNEDPGEDLDENLSENLSVNLEEEPIEALSEDLGEDPMEALSEDQEENPIEAPGEDLEEDPSEARSEDPEEIPDETQEENPNEEPSEEEPVLIVLHVELTPLNPPVVTFDSEVDVTVNGVVVSSVQLAEAGDSLVFRLALEAGQEIIRILLNESEPDNSAGDWTDIWDGVSADADWAGQGTKAAPYQIATAAQLYGLAKRVNELGETMEDTYFVLVADLDMNGYPWTPIGGNMTLHEEYLSWMNSFQGHLDGNGYIISNLNITSKENYVGLFGYMLGATVENLTLDNISVTGNAFVGGIAGAALAGSEISNCTVLSGSVKGTHVYTNSQTRDFTRAGGLIGRLSGSMDGCVNCASVTGSYCVGGLIGSVEDEASVTHLNECRNAGAITGEGYTGGVVGWTISTDKLDRLENTGTVTGGIATGGVVGQILSGTLNECTNRADIEGTRSTGGLVGILQSSVVSRSYNTGGVTLRAVTFQRPATALDIQTAGGLVGATLLVGSVENSYNTGAVTAPDGAQFGGIVGALMQGTALRNVFWLNTAAENAAGSTAGTVVQENARSLRTDQMLYRNLLPELNGGEEEAFTWDCTGENKGYPVAAWQSPLEITMDDENVWTVQLKSVQNDTAVKVEVSQINYDVSWEACEDFTITPAEDTPIPRNYGDDFRFTLTLSPGYEEDGQDTLTVMANGEPLVLTKLADKRWSAELTDLKEDQYLEVSGYGYGTYTVLFDTTGGAPESGYGYRVTYPDKAPVPANPKRGETGEYTFLGWYTDPNALEKYDFSLPITGDLTLYAGWYYDQGMYMVYDLNLPAQAKASGVYTGKTSVKYLEEQGAALSQPPVDPTCTYSSSLMTAQFLGWSLEEDDRENLIDLSTYLVPELSAAQMAQYKQKLTLPETTLYAQWEVTSHPQESQDGQGTYEISTEADLRDLAESFNSGRVTSEGAELILTNDIALTQALVIGTPDYPFQGTLSGWTGSEDTHYQITLAPGTQANGLFGYVGENGLVEYVDVSGDVETVKTEDTGTGTFAVGILANVNMGTISNCTVYGSVRGYGVVGGIAGSSGSRVSESASLITGCVNNAAVTATEKPKEQTGVAGGGSQMGGNSYTKGTGGIVGACYGVIEDCVNNGAISYESSGTSSWMGGICGEFTGARMENCVNHGSIRATSIVGGIVGGMYCLTQTELKDCVNTGSVTTKSAYVGGLIGSVWKNLKEGEEDGERHLTFRGCLNSGDIKSEGTTSANGYKDPKSSYESGTAWTGGMVGTSETTSTNFTFCGNSGYISASGSYTGGLAGGLRGSASLNYCYSTGGVNTAGATNCVGGLVGWTVGACSVQNGYVYGDKLYIPSLDSGYAVGAVGYKSAGLGTANIQNFYYSNDSVGISGVEIPEPVGEQVYGISISAFRSGEVSYLLDMGSADGGVSERDKKWSLFDETENTLNERFPTLIYHAGMAEDNPSYEYYQVTLEAALEYSEDCPEKAVTAGLDSMVTLTEAGGEQVAAVANSEPAVAYAGRTLPIQLDAVPGDAWSEEPEEIVDEDGNVIAAITRTWHWEVQDVSVTYVRNTDSSTNSADVQETDNGNYLFTLDQEGNYAVQVSFLAVCEEEVIQGELPEEDPKEDPEEDPKEEPEEQPEETPEEEKPNVKPDAKPEQRPALDPEDDPGNGNGDGTGTGDGNGDGDGSGNGSGDGTGNGNDGTGDHGDGSGNDGTGDVPGSDADSSSDLPSIGHGGEDDDLSMDDPDVPLAGTPDDMSQPENTVIAPVMEESLIDQGDQPETPETPDEPMADSAGEQGGSQEGGSGVTSIEEPDVVPMVEEPEDVPETTQPRIFEVIKEIGQKSWAWLLLLLCAGVVIIGGIARGYRKYRKDEQDESK